MESLGQPSSLLTDMLCRAGVWRVFRTVKVQNNEMSAPVVQSKDLEWIVIPRCLRWWTDVTESYLAEHDNKHDVDTKLLLVIYVVSQSATIANSSVAVLGNNFQNIFNSSHTWASRCRLRKP
jgi:hypothetical protein